MHTQATKFVQNIHLTPTVFWDSALLRRRHVKVWMQYPTSRLPQSFPSQSLRRDRFIPYKSLKTSVIYFYKEASLATRSVLLRALGLASVHCWSSLYSTLPTKQHEDLAFAWRSRAWKCSQHTYLLPSLRVPSLRQSKHRNSLYIVLRLGTCIQWDFLNLKLVSMKASMLRRTVYVYSTRFLYLIIRSTYWRLTLLSTYTYYTTHSHQDKIRRRQYLEPSL